MVGDSLSEFFGVIVSSYGEAEWEVSGDDAFESAARLAEIREFYETPPKFNYPEVSAFLQRCRQKFDSERVGMLLSEWESRTVTQVGAWNTRLLLSDFKD